MSMHLKDRTTEPDRLVQALAAAAAALYLALAGWLISLQVSDRVSYLPAVHVDNQTQLTLLVELVDQHGARLSMGAHQPGHSSSLEVVDLGPSWTFESSYGGRRVDRQTLDRATLARKAGPCTFPPWPPPTWNAPGTGRWCGA